jgi:hypothetical protein
MLTWMSSSPTLFCIWLGNQQVRQSTKQIQHITTGQVQLWILQQNAVTAVSGFFVLALQLTNIKDYQAILIPAVI